MSLKTGARLLAAITIWTSAPALHAAGDLLVAPTRVVLDNNSGAEIVLNNRDKETATYRISLVLRKMLVDGQFEEVTQPTPEQQKTLDMISYAPRRVILAPGQTQTIRLSARVPADLLDGEYRVHMLMRAIPNPGQAAADASQNGLSIALTPVYGVTIPVIARKGVLTASAALDNVRLEQQAGHSALTMDLSRTGNRSIYGSVQVFRPGKTESLFTVKGIAVYTEVAHRTVRLPLPDAVAAGLKGPVIVRFSEDSDVPGKLVAEANTRL